MDDCQAKKIENDCREFVRDLCERKNIGFDHGFEHAVIVANLARIGLSDFKLTCLESLLVILASLMHDIDDPKVFETVNYANARAFLHTVELHEDDKQFVIRMISLVSYSQNKNTVPQIPKWALIPRDADRIAGGGLSGVARAIAFNSTRPLVLPEDLQLFSSFPVNREAIKSKYNNTTTKQKSLFEFYITNWYDRGVCASGSEKLQKLFTKEFNDLLDFWVENINRLRSVEALRCL